MSTYIWGMSDASEIKYVWVLRLTHALYKALKHKYIGGTYGFVREPTQWIIFISKCIILIQNGRFKLVHCVQSWWVAIVGYLHNSCAPENCFAKTYLRCMYILKLFLNNNNGNIHDFLRPKRKIHNLRFLFT